MGDGANDLPMIKTAGIASPFVLNQIVREQAPYQITEPDLYKVIEIWMRLRNRTDKKSPFG